MCSDLWQRDCGHVMYADNLLGHILAIWIEYELTVHEKLSCVELWNVGNVCWITLTISSNFQKSFSLIYASKLHDSNVSKKLTFMRFLKSTLHEFPWCLLLLLSKNVKHDMSWQLCSCFTYSKKCVKCFVTLGKNSLIFGVFLGVIHKWRLKFSLPELLLTCCL